MKRTTILLAAMAMVFGPNVSAQEYTFVTLNHPDTISRTFAFGINDSGDVVGNFSNGSGSHGYDYDGSNYTTLDVPDAQDTFAYGINDSGVIVGYYSDSDYNSQIFIYNKYIADHDGYSTLSVPGATYNEAYGINDSGTIVGFYIDGSGGNHGFVYDGSTWTTLDVPGATVFTEAWGINDSGYIVGRYADGSGIHGFLYDGITYSTLDVPGALRTIAYGINDLGFVVGEYRDSSGVIRGFVYDGSDYTMLHISGAQKTVASGINDSGHITGSFLDSNFHYRGFIVVENISAANYDYSGDDGDPVNTYTGEYFFIGTRDIYLGGPMPLFFSRYYASGIKQSGITGSTTEGNVIFQDMIIKNNSNDKGGGSVRVNNLKIKR